MYYCAMITRDYCEFTDFSLVSFFKHNNVILNLFVIDNNYNKVVDYYKDKHFYSKLNIIDIYDEQIDTEIKNFKHNDVVFSTDVAHKTLWMFKILDYINEDEIMRIDLDVLYFNSLDQFSKYKSAMNGVRESEDEFNMIKSYDPDSHPSKVQINVGICKFIKSKFNIESFYESMKMKLNNDAIHYLIPEQDILNELTDDKSIFSDMTIITNYCNIKNIDYHKEVLAFHFNGTYTKPWNYTEINKIYFSNYIYVCGVELMKFFNRFVEFRNKEIRINSAFTIKRYLSPTNINETMMKSLTEHLKRKIEYEYS